ncbi:NAD(P)-binding protein [Earliella scabrosa]|nr:NAD(P)-binding protein [Earliella scabrosa]
MPDPQSPKVWFITGTSSGIGRAVTEVLLEKGEIVVATARRPNTLDDLVQKYPTDRLLPLQLDITQSEEIEAAFLRTMEAFGRIDVVLNNAGCASLGEVEALDESQGRAVMETNFWGTLRVSKEAVRFFRESNPSGLGGRLLQMSSYLGLTAGPGVGYYAASKFALEGLTESLAAELDPDWNIKITLIEPGWITSAAAEKTTWCAPHPAYAKKSLPCTMMRAAGYDLVEWKNARKCGEVFYKIASLSNPPLHFVVGKDAIGATRQKLAGLLEVVEKYESWSAGLEEQ